MEFTIEFIDYLGEVKNDTNINGKAFVFKIIDQDLYTFETILFVHPTVKEFLSMIDKKHNPTIIIEKILEKYNKEELLKY
jgi:hypothetical protein